MSEHYDFHYQPTGSGAISGQQVLEQTEDAINELGDYVNDNVGGAMDVAQQALETAQNAEQDAQTALDTANSFSSAIQSAQQDASTALSTAQTAQTTASNANNTALQAQQDASSAVTTANNASGQVSTLSGTVTALGQRVTTAEGNIGQNTSDITALTTRVGTAEGNITTLQNDVSVAMGNASSAMATAGTVKQQAYVFRYSSTALVASSTNANSLLDNTDNLKVGDKVVDSSGVLFSITAIDSVNSTFTIGSALIDLALDANVVHKSGNETVGGIKSFSSDLSIANTDTTANTPNLNLRNYKVDRGTTATGVQAITFLDKNAKALTLIESRRISNGNTGTNILTYNTDDSNNTVSGGVSIIKSKTDTSFSPNADNAVTCGRALAKWSDVQTYKVNALEPSSLSLPSGNVSDVIDISSYITALDGTSNSYTVPANGWISIAVVGIFIAIVSSSWSDSRLRASSGNVRMLYPVLKNETVSISIEGTTLAYARFIPCQGNV